MGAGKRVGRWVGVKGQLMFWIKYLFFVGLLVSTLSIGSLTNVLTVTPRDDPPQAMSLLFSSDFDII